MSGIYIKAFKAPMSCWDCQFRGLKALVGCTVGLTYSNRDDMGIASANCKIISVPDHGRLVDADELEVLSWTEDPTKTFDDGVMFALDKLDALPTVIPADKGARE